MKRTTGRKRKEATGRKGRGAAASAKCQVTVIPVILNTEDTEKETCKSEVKLRYTASPRALRSCLNKKKKTFSKKKKEKQNEDEAGRQAQ